MSQIFKLDKRWRIKYGIFYLKMMCFRYGWRCWWGDRSEEALLSENKVQLKLLGIHFIPMYLTDQMTYTPDMGFGYCIQRCNPIKNYKSRPVQTIQGDLPELGKSLPTYLIFQQANEHAKEPLWPQNRCWHELCAAKFSKQPFPERLPLMSELIHQINTEKQKGNTTLTSEISKKYPW